MMGGSMSAESVQDRPVVADFIDSTAEDVWNTLVRREEALTPPASVELEPLLKGMRKGETLEQFLYSPKGGPPDPSWSIRRDQLIHRVIRILTHRLTPFNVAKIIKGGSIGKNTTVMGSSDVDLFLFLSDFTSLRDMKLNTRRILDIIKSRLELTAWDESAATIEFKPCTKHAIKLVLSCDDLDQSLTMDILPAFDVLKDADSVHDVYEEMRRQSTEDLEYYSVCLAPLQVEFIKRAPSKVQDLMRIIKYWTKVELNAAIKLTSSYFMEVLVMHRWHEAGRPYNIDITDWFEGIATQLLDFPSLHIVWEDRYSAATYRHVPANPVVLDPANPHNNIVPSERQRDIISRHAQSFLGRLTKLRNYRASGPPPILDKMRRGQRLQQFIEDTIQPGSDNRRACGGVVERVTYFLQNHTDFSVSMVVKGGSLGKSTNVLNKSDVDLVVFINDVRTVADLQVHMETILARLRSDLETKWSDYAGELTFIRQTGHGLNYRLSCRGDEEPQEVDILPACNLLRDRSPLQIYEEMNRRSEKERAFYSVSFAPKQVEFVKRIPAKLKNLIRLVKYWAMTEVNIELKDGKWKTKKKVSSYFLESLVISRWNQWPDRDNFNTDEKFKDIMTQLANLDSIRILWPDQYTARNYDIDISCPVLLDKANPFNNLVPLEKHQAAVVKNAEDVLRKISDLENYRRGRFLDY